MNRRELFTTIARTAAASGVTVTAASYAPQDEKPALVVIECDHAISNLTAERLQRAWEDGTKGTPFEGVKAIVLTEGLKLTMLDATGKPIHRIL